MTTLLVSGDSWTSGWPLEERLGHRNFSWPNLVSQHFKFELIDKSRAGSSNDRIYRKTFDGMLANVDIAIVCLTSWARFESGLTTSKKPASIYQHLPHQAESSLAYKTFFNSYLSYTNLLRKIISLQSLAEKTNTKCFFLDTFKNNLFFDMSLNEFCDMLKHNISVFDNMDDQRIANKFKTVKMLESNVDFSSFISKKSYQEIVKDCKFDQYHPVEDGHRQIADVIINFLESKYYGKTL